MIGGRFGVKKNDCDFAVFCVLMTLLNIRIASLATSTELKETALNQRSYTLTAANARGQIYDRNFKRLVNIDRKTVSAVLPQPETTVELLNVVSKKERNILYQDVKTDCPF